MTYAGKPMTRAIFEDARSCGAEIWYLMDPATGSNTLSVNTNWGNRVTAAFSFSGVSFDGGPIVDVAVSDASGATSCSINLTTVDGGFMVGVMSGDLGADREISPAAGITEKDEGYHAGNDANWWAGYGAASGSSDNWGCTWSGAGDQSSAAISIRPGSGDPDKVEFDTIPISHFNDGDSTPHSASYDVGGADMLVLLMGARKTLGGGTDITSVTYNGVSLTEQKEQDANGSDTRAWIWTLLSPASGSNTLVITGTQWSDLFGVAMGINGVDLGDPIVGTAGAGDMSVSLAGEENGLILSVIADHGASLNDWPPANDNALNDADYDSGSQVGVATTYARTWNDTALTTGMHGTTSSIGVASIALRPVSSGVTRSAMFFSLAGLVIPTATLVGLYKAGAVEL